MKIGMLAKFAFGPSRGRMPSLATMVHKYAKPRTFTTQQVTPLDVDIAIIGAGPAGLSAGQAIRSLDANISMAIFEQGGARSPEDSAVTPLVLTHIFADSIS